MNWSFNILILILLLSACAPVKKTESSNTAKQEVTSRRDSLNTSSGTSTNTFTQKKDSTIGIPKKTVTHDFTPEDLQPVYTKEGKAVPRTFVKDSAGISMKVTVHPDGSVNMQCKADSFALVIRSLDSTVTEIRDSVSYWKDAYFSKNETSNTHKETVKVYDLMFYLKWVLIIGGVVAIVILIIKRFL